MSVTLAEMRADVRALLLDLVDPYTWPDTLVNQAINEACLAYSYLYPLAVRLRFDLAAGVQGFAVWSTNTLTAGPVTGPVGPGAAQLITVQRVEMPIGIILPMDPGQATDPAASGSTAYRQAWRERGGYIYLHNPLTADASAYVELLQTWPLPDTAGTVLWSAPAIDRALIYLLAQRAAYQQLSAINFRDGSTAKDKPDPDKLIGRLESAIAQALAARTRRSLGSRPLDI